MASAEAIVAFGAEHKETFEVWIEIDTDGHRSGIRPGEAALLAVGRVLHEGGARLGGVMTHAGSSYDLGHARSPGRDGGAGAGRLRQRGQPAARSRPALPGCQRGLDPHGAFRKRPGRRHRRCALASMYSSTWSCAMSACVRRKTWR
ncbi:alanine racemase [Cupriavidus basilensis]